MRASAGGRTLQTSHPPRKKHTAKKMKIMGNPALW
jgi:hypothetical protein